MQVLRCQPENGAVNVDQLPVALTRPRHEGPVSPLDPSALSRHLGTQDLQAPKVSTAGSVRLSLHHAISAVPLCVCVLSSNASVLVVDCLVFAPYQLDYILI